MAIKATSRNEIESFSEGYKMYLKDGHVVRVKNGETTIGYRIYWRK